MKPDYSMGRNFEQPLLIQLIEKSDKRSNNALLSYDGNYDFTDKEVESLTKLDKIMCVKIKAF